MIHVKLYRTNYEGFYDFYACYWNSRLLVVPHFSSGIVEPAKRERAWKSPHARKGDTRYAWGYFHASSRFARPTIPEKKWGTTRSLLKLLLKALTQKKLFIAVIVAWNFRTFMQKKSANFFLLYLPYFHAVESKKNISNCEKIGELSIILKNSLIIRKISSNSFALYTRSTISFVSK